MKVNKKNITMGTIEKYIVTFILLLVLFMIIAEVFPDVGEAADTMNESGFPLAGFFSADGVLWYLVAAGLLFAIYKTFTSGWGGKRK